MDSTKVITFYDIASNAPLRTFSPNPWKTRFALNFKGLPYETRWVQLPDIASLREGLGVPATRTLPDGSPYYTLPMIQDAATGKIIGDTFEIAVYLDEAYPETPKLIRPGSTGLTAAFNAHVDSIFTKFAIFFEEMPFDPSVQDAVYAILTKRAREMSPEPLQLNSEQREQTFVAFEAALGELAKAYRHTGGTTDHVWRIGGTAEAQSQRPPPGREQAGPFLEGDEPVYADFIVGAWLKALEASMKPDNWQRLTTWQSGMWGRLVVALNKWSVIK